MVDHFKLPPTVPIHFKSSTDFSLNSKHKIKHLIFGVSFQNINIDNVIELFQKKF